MGAQRAIHRGSTAVVSACWLLLVIFVTCHHLLQRRSARRDLGVYDLLEKVLLSPEKKERLGAIRDGSLTRANVEIVIATPPKADISWSNAYANVRTIRCVIHSLAFLQHIVENYDRLANLTVFSQGSPRLLANSSIHDSALSTSSRGHFVFTAAASLTTLAVRIRRGYNRQISREQGLSSCPVPPLDAPGGTERKYELEDEGAPRTELERVAKICAKDPLFDATAGSIPCSLSGFWDSVLQIPRPPFDTVLFAHSQVFAVTSEQLRRRPRSFYLRLLRTVSSSPDPAAAYFLDHLWWYVLGGTAEEPGPGPGVPCPLSGREWQWVAPRAVGAPTDLRKRLAILEELGPAERHARDEYRSTFY